MASLWFALYTRYTSVTPTRLTDFSSLMYSSRDRLKEILTKQNREGVGAWGGGGAGGSRLRKTVACGPVSMADTFPTVPSPFMSRGVSLRLHWHFCIVDGGISTIKLPSIGILPRAGLWAFDILHFHRVFISQRLCHGEPPFLQHGQWAFLPG